MIYYLVFLGLMTLGNVREVRTVEYSTSFINNLSKPKDKQSDQGHISDQIQRNFQHIREADKENEDEQIFNIRRQKKSTKKRSEFFVDSSKAPYFVVVMGWNNDDEGSQCGGSILNNCHILTAAHCVSTKIKGESRFRAFDTDKIAVFNGATQSHYDEDSYDDINNNSDIKALGVWIHPKYLKKSTIDFYKDIAVVRTRVMIYSDRLKSVPIYPRLHKDNVAQMECTCVHWGTVDRVSLELVQIELMSLKECTNLRHGLYNRYVHVCAFIGMDAWIEDGTGLVCDGMLLAMTTWMKPYGGGITICVFARVDNELDFITPILEQVDCKAASFSPIFTTLLNVILLHFTQY